MVITRHTAGALGWWNEQMNVENCHQKEKQSVLVGIFPPLKMISRELGNPKSLPGRGDCKF